MAVRVGINGFGRIGRYALRSILVRKDMEIVAINSRADVKVLAHLFKYDSIHGKYGARINCDGDCMIVDGTKIMIFREANELGAIPWGGNGVDVVLECTGKFRKKDEMAGHLEGGAKKVILAAPGKGMDATIVLGVNEDVYDPSSHHIISNASCTTNCLAPIVKIINDGFGIEKGFMTTVHSYTMDQRLLDGSHKDLRRARAAALSMVPTTTGAAGAVGQVIPEMKGKLDGFAIRVPTPNVSLVDLVVNLKKDATPEAINAAVKKEAEGPMAGIVDYCDEELVSIDFQSSSFSAIFDAPLTNVLDGKMAKVIAWYDNESGYTERLVDLAHYVGIRL